MTPAVIVERAHKLFDQFEDGRITASDLTTGMQGLVDEAWDVMRSHYLQAVA